VVLAKVAGAIGKVIRSSKFAVLLLGVSETVPQTDTMLPTLWYWKLPLPTLLAEMLAVLVSVGV